MKRVLLLSFFALAAVWFERDVSADPAGCNVNGCWPDGGGCNVNGCWGPGGGCNVNGCWGPRMRPQPSSRHPHRGYEYRGNDGFGYGGYRDDDDDDRWGAVVASTQDGGWGWAIQRVFANAAIRDAQNQCNGNCSIVQTFGPGQCGAIATSADHAWGRASGSTRAWAEDAALAFCREHASSDCAVAVWACN